MLTRISDQHEFNLEPDFYFSKIFGNLELAGSLNYYKKITALFKCIQGNLTNSFGKRTSS